MSAKGLLLIGVLIVLVLSAVAIINSQIHSTTPVTRHTATFNFDTGYPPLTQTQTTPFNQTSTNITAYFSSPSDTASSPAFSITSQATTSFQLSQFSGQYLYDNKPSRDILDIKFSSEILDVRFTFATIEHQNQAITVPSDILLTGYANTKLVGSLKASGSFSADSYPQGTISFYPGLPFNWIRISLPSQTSGTTDFLVDNIIVTIVSKPTP